jgi:hypothetical protein
MLDIREPLSNSSPVRGDLPAADNSESVALYWCELCGRWVQNLLHASEARFKDAHQTQGAA